MKQSSPVTRWHSTISGMLRRFTFALLLALLPACATLIGVLVLRQIPTVLEVAGVLLVVGGVALHQEVADA